MLGVHRQQALDKQDCQRHFTCGDQLHSLGALNESMLRNRHAARAAVCCRSGLRLGLALGQRGRGGFLEFAADVAGVAVGEVEALHPQDVGDAFDRINPRLRAPRAAMSVNCRVKAFPRGQEFQGGGTDDRVTQTDPESLPTLGCPLVSPRRRGWP